ncbi:MAG: response regulator [Spartobacteria bacterium]
MFDHDDLKWLATNATELNRLLQSVSRTADQVRQHQADAQYLELLDEQVEQASRTSQALFNRITGRILASSGEGATEVALAPAWQAVAASTPAARSNVSVRIPAGEVTRNLAGELGEIEIRNPQGTRELILLVDDDLELLDTTGAMLEFEDYRLVLAKDGFEALEIYRRMKDKIALVILDYFLPVMDGDAVFDELKAIDPNIRVVLSSGFGEQAKLGSMLARGLRGFIPKPYSHEKLVDQIRLVLDA